MSKRMKKVFKEFEEKEKELSQERKEMLDRVGESVRRFVVYNSYEALESFIKSLSRQEFIEFYTAWYWDCYKCFKARKVQKGVVA